MNIADRIRLEHGDSRDVVKRLADEGVQLDAVVCDPPYALVSIVKRFGKPGSAPTRDGDVYSRASAGFMGKQWDTGETAFDPKFWADVLKIMKPGAHLIAFSGTRTYHRMACAIEDAGFEIRDQIVDLVASDTFVQRFLTSLTPEQRLAFLRCVEESRFGGMLRWIYGSGFPKNHDISKHIDKMAGAARPVIATRRAHDIRSGNLMEASQGIGRGTMEYAYTAPATAAAAAWRGWGTALKPSEEPIVLARKPIINMSVSECVLKHCTGALNIDACRVDYASDADKAAAAAEQRSSQVAERSFEGWSMRQQKLSAADYLAGAAAIGRWPANVIHDGSDEVMAAFPVADGQHGTHDGDTSGGVFGKFNGRAPAGEPRNDSGSAARFFYAAKADAEDRFGSKHPTVKPIDLMAYLCRLVTPPGGLVLDPFAGSGTTGVACLREGFRCILIEREAEYVADIKARLEFYSGEGAHSAQVKNRKVDAGKAAGADAPLFKGMMGEMG